MKASRWVYVTGFLLATMSSQALSQEKSKSEDKPAAVTVKLVVTFSETSGDKKVLNLPYMVLVKTKGSGNSPLDSMQWGKVRVGERVPLATSMKEGEFTYLDVGTNIDAQAAPAEGGGFHVSLNLERSAVEDEPAPSSGTSKAESAQGCFKQPTVRQFKTQLNLLMKDGQTIQGVQAADPLDGRLLSVSVTMNVVK